MTDTLFDREKITEQDKVISLFRYIQELNKLKQRSIINVKDYPWFYSLSSLPDDPENITLRYRDRVENEDLDVSSTILLVHKPEFTKCPEPSYVFGDWLKQGWEDFRQVAVVKDILEEAEKDNPLINIFDDNNTEDDEPEHFGDNEERVQEFGV